MKNLFWLRGLYLAVVALRALPILAQPILSLVPGRFGTSLEFQIEGSPGPKWLEATTDFTSWEALTPTHSESQFVVHVALDPMRPNQFFRARAQVAPPPNDLNAHAEQVTSTSARLVWSLPAAAAATRIYLAPEPELAALSGPARKLLMTQTTGETGFNVTGLAAATDCFFQIEADTAVGITKRSLVHARTAGGPRAQLDTRLREVQGFAPNVLLVTLVNGPTNTLKEGWSVTRANGAAIRVVAVYRNSIPVSTGDYPLSWRCCGTLAVTETDHRMFLVLAEPIGNSALLEISGPEGLHFTLPFSDRYLETPVIQLNQLGYNPRATKRWAYVSGWMGDGGGLSLDNFPNEADVLREPEDFNSPRTTSLNKLPITLRSALDPMSGTTVREINLAALPPNETARYRVRLPGVGVSWPTAVSDKAAFKAFYTVARGLFHNRRGGDLRPDLTDWSRPADHPFVFTGESVEWNGTADGGFPFKPTTPMVGLRTLAGGHHDAGDFDIRPIHTGVAQLLMRAYEMEPTAFVDGQLNLPESGNGIPDLLDEALWSIAAWEQLQEDDGGVRLGVESYRHPNNQGILASEDREEDNGDQPMPYWTYGREANHSARCAGLFAQAARLTAPFDAARSESLKQRAIKAWNYATNHAAQNPVRLYPASELFRLTGDVAWRAIFDSVWNSLGSTDEAVSHFSFATRPNPSDYATAQGYDPDHILAYLATVSPTEPKAEFMRNLYHAHAVGAAAFSENEGKEAHRNAHPWTHAVTFGQSLSQGSYFGELYAAQQLGLLNENERIAAFNGLSLAADYILGGNPNGLVYLTGLGTRHIEEPLHLDSLAFIKLGKGPIPGIPVYGPVDGKEDNDYAAQVMAAFYPEIGSEESSADHTRPALAGHPLGRRHADVRLWVKANEFSVWEMQGPHVQLFAALMQGTRGILPPTSYRPGGVDHRNSLP